MDYNGQSFGKSWRSFLYSGVLAYFFRSCSRASSSSSWLIFNALETIPVVSSKPSASIAASTAHAREDVKIFFARFRCHASIYPLSNPLPARGEGRVRVN